MSKVEANQQLNQKMGVVAWQKSAVKNTWQDYGDRLLAEYARRLDGLARNRSL